MPKFLRRIVKAILFLVTVVVLQRVAALAQEPAGRTGGDAIFAQFGRGDLQRADSPGGTAEDSPRDMIALTVWALVVSNNNGPEADELVGQLLDKAKRLPTNVGSVDDVREFVSKLRTAGLLQRSREFRLTAIDGQPVGTQAGVNQPRIISTNISTISPGRGGRGRGNFEPNAGAAPTPDGAPDESPWADAALMNSINYREAGTSLQLTPTIDATGAVKVQFNLNTSEMEPAPDVPISEIPGRKPILADKIVTSQIQSALRLKSGTAVVVHSDSIQSAEGESPTDTTRIVILGASVQPAVEQE